MNDSDLEVEGAGATLADDDTILGITGGSAGGPLI